MVGKLLEKLIETLQDLHFVSATYDWILKIIIKVNKILSFYSFETFD